MNDSAEVPSSTEPQVRKRRVWPIWLLVVLLVMSTATGFAMFYQSQQKQQKTAETLKITETNLDNAKNKLKQAVILPDSAQYSPQCDSANNDKTRLALINPEPIDGYNVYISSCIDSLIAGDLETTKVIIFKVNQDGTQEFAYGAGRGEPYCVSEKIIPAEAAANISKATGFPVCKTF